MDIYALIKENGAEIKKDNITKIMEELIEVVKENGIPEVFYNAGKNMTEFKFEGKYNTFSVFLS